MTSATASPYTARAYSLVLEHVRCEKAVMLQVITRVDASWQGLSDWLKQGRGSRHSDVRTHTSSGIPKLAAAFSIRDDTNEVLLALPWVSLPKLYRASNAHEDEVAFRSTCARLALCILGSGCASPELVHQTLKEIEMCWGAEDCQGHSPHPEFRSGIPSEQDAATLLRISS
ncbi:hypothetical protein CRENBAI_013492 [Crenichthys baileyi]|uniref:Uncharacterized protein n=1 Tax=Crenichthys baileyi TaxID=28760 RepID=A0AAV9SB99_9TELE